MDLSIDLDELGTLHGTDKCSLAHDYLRHYAAMVERFRSSPITLLEIGVFRGGSLRMWEDYLPLATIVGVDIQEHCRQHAGGRRIVEIGSQADPEFLGTIGTKYLPSIVIDDGSHRADHIQMTFETLFPHLQDGGLYLIEDVHFHAGRSGEALRGTATLSPQQYFTPLACLAVGSGAGYSFDPAIVHMTDRVEFFHGAIAVWKKPAHEPDPIAARRAIVAQVNKPDIWGYFGMMILKNRGDPAEALHAIQMAIQLDPKEALHYHRLSFAFERVGDHAAALAAARQAVVLFPQHNIFLARVADLEAKPVASAGAPA